MDRAAFSQQVRTHHRRLIAYATSILGESDTSRDVVQEALVTAYENLERFEVSRDFGAWLRGIVRNKCREERRRKHPTPLDDDALEALEILHLEWAEIDQSGGPGLWIALEDCLAQLDAGLKSAVDLFYYEDCSGDECAERLELSSGSVRKRLQRARESLRLCLHNKAPQG